MAELATFNASGSPLLTDLRSALGLLKQLAQSSWETIDSAEATFAVELLEQANRYTTSIQSSVLAQVESSGAWEGTGQRTISNWVTARTGSSRNSAYKAVKLAKTLKEQLPSTKKALAQGLISEEQAQTISRECTKTENLRTRLNDSERGEAYLVKKAQETDASTFTKLAKGWAIETDPKGADQGWREEAARESFTLTPVAGGFRAQGHLDPVSGRLIQEALDSFVGRKAAEDDRPLPQRLAQALTSMARQSLDSGFQLPHARIRPHLTITMDYSTLQGLVNATVPHEPGEASTIISTELDYSLLQGLSPATLSDGTAIPPAVLARLACQSTLTRVVFGPESTVLDAGRAERIFPAHHVRAIIARDQRCQYPGCTESPNRCEVHHSLEWFKHNGTTHVDLGILLCYHHHDVVHQNNLVIARHGGRWIFTEANGVVIQPPSLGSTLEPEPTRPPTRAPTPPGTSTPQPAGQNATCTWQEELNGNILFDTGPPPF